MAIDVDEETAEIDTCRIEYVINGESFQKLKEAYKRGEVGLEHLYEDAPHKKHSPKKLNQ